MDVREKLGVAVDESRVTRTELTSFLVDNMLSTDDTESSEIDTAHEPPS